VIRVVSITFLAVFFPVLFHEACLASYSAMEDCSPNPIQGLSTKRYKNSYAYALAEIKFDWNSSLTKACFFKDTWGSRYSFIRGDCFAGEALVAAVGDFEDGDFQDPFGDNDPFDDPFDDPFGDTTTSTEENSKDIADPLESVNRIVFAFNDKLYMWVLKPVTKGYKTVVGRFVRECVRNFFHNIAFPIRFTNCLLQGKVNGAGEEVSRFIANSTIGIAGLFDPATNWLNIDEHDEDFGQTLGFYGIGHGIYLTLPLVGPSSLRDGLGTIGDEFAYYYGIVDSTTLEKNINHDAYRLLKGVSPTRKKKISAHGLDSINSFSFRGDDYESLRDASLDPYTALRDFYFQTRKNAVAE